MIARTNSAKADYGSSYLLQAVLVSILGGVSPTGGLGTIWGVVIALLSLQFLSSGFNMLRFSHFVKEFTWGMLLLIVMVVNFTAERRSRQIE
jgi:simple sugar transport system permease protein